MSTGALLLAVLGGALPLDAAPLHVGLVCEDDATARRVSDELADVEGTVGARCAVDIECSEDTTCATTALRACHVEALLAVAARTESDGDWVKAIVVDSAGAIAFSLEQPAADGALLPAGAVETLAALARDAAPARVEPPHDDVAPAARSERAVVDETAPPSVAPVALTGAAVGLGVGVIASGIALANEAVRNDPRGDAEARIHAEGVARIAWITAIGGVALAVAGGAVYLALQPE